MALNASVLAELIQAKIVEKNPDSSTSERSNLVDALAEAIVEHITTMAEVRVPVVGLDLGSTLSTDWGDRFAQRGDLAVPGALVPDTGLQNETNASAVLPTTPPAASIMISTPGFID